MRILFHEPGKVNTLGGVLLTNDIVTECSPPLSVMLGWTGAHAVLHARQKGWAVEYREPESRYA